MNENQKPILELTLSKMGNFRLGLFTATPYQHHLNKWTWEVIVSKQDDADDAIFQIERFKVVANRASLAASRAINSWDKALEEKKARAKLKTFLKKGDPNGETNNTTGKEPELHSLESERDLGDDD